MESKNKRTHQTSKSNDPTFEPRPQKVDIDKVGPQLIERNRKVLDMLEEYDRRQEKRRVRRQ